MNNNAKHIGWKSNFNPKVGFTHIAPLLASSISKVDAFAPFSYFFEPWIHLDIFLFFHSLFYKNIGYIKHWSQLKISLHLTKFNSQ